MPPKKTLPRPFRPKLSHRKSKGEWAEIAFMARATGLGFTVCKPYGENHRFDFLVYAPETRVTRVQVKSSWSCKSRGVYQLKTSGCGIPYRRGEVDFIAGYVVPEDAWYIVPVGKITKHDVVTVSPHKPNSRGRLEKYREAWDLLRRPRRGRGGLDLYACADPLAVVFCSTAEQAEGAGQVPPDCAFPRIVV